jgi:hypothetical protein
MTLFLDRLRTFMALLYTTWLGTSTMHVVSINNDPTEVYRIQTVQGEWVRFYCRETIYKIAYHAWWVPNARLYTYEVYGSCEAPIPEDVAKRICQSVTLGRLLPRFAPRRLQKQAAIHAHVSLIASQLGQGRSTVSAPEV